MKNHSLANPKAVAEAGERIYQEKNQKQFEAEAENIGKFLVVDVVAEEAYIGDSPELALNLAKKKAPRGVFHLIKIGFPGAFRVSYSNAAPDWLFR
jgi:hypothetical protein